MQAAKSEVVMQEEGQGSIIRISTHSHITDHMDAPTEDDQAPLSAGADVPEHENVSNLHEQQAVDVSDEAASQLTIGEGAVPGSDVAADSVQHEEQPSPSCAACEATDVSGKPDMGDQTPVDADKPANTRHYGRFDSSVVNGEATEVRHAPPSHPHACVHAPLPSIIPMLHASTYLSPCLVCHGVSVGPV